jgi:hypothetical protein
MDFAEGPSKEGTIGANISLSACLTEEKLYWQWDIVVEVCEKVKGEFDGDQSDSAVPS